MNRRGGGRGSCHLGVTVLGIWRSWFSAGTHSSEVALERDPKVTSLGFLCSHPLGPCERDLIRQQGVCRCGDVKDMR